MATYTNCNQFFMKREAMMAAKHIYSKVANKKILENAHS